MVHCDVWAWGGAGNGHHGQRGVAHVHEGAARTVAGLLPNSLGLHHQGGVSSLLVLFVET